VCCFDKTGTLTEDGLDILGVRPVDRTMDRFGELIENIHDLPARDDKDKARFLYALATCHSLKVVDDDIVGDPLDVRMWQFTNWELEEGNVTGAGTGMIKGGKTGEDRPAALVQTVVRPPGGGTFRMEDALKGNTRVNIPQVWWSFQANLLCSAHIFWNWALFERLTSCRAFVV
jgi:cation-transporting P-type ATPase 13A2